MRLTKESLLAIALVTCSFSVSASAREITTNEVHMQDAPSWVTRLRVQKDVDVVQRYLDWDVRRIQCYWYADQARFRKIHGFDDTVLAFTRRADGTVHIGPHVTTRDFDGVFQHELVHVIVAQKYKDAIPKWLEEGLANYVAKRGAVDYAWLASQPAIDVRTLSHPFSAVTTTGAAALGSQYHYMASRALAEMIASHCDLEDLLQLSVGSSLENYLSTTCGIDDLNAEFRAWVARKKNAAKVAKPVKTSG